MTDPYAWRASIRDDWAVDGVRLFIHRSTGEHLDVITGFDDQGRWSSTREAVGVAHDFPGLLIPQGVLEALAEQVKPGPSQGEVKRLEEALEVERRRVDELLTQLHGVVRSAS